MENKRKLLLMSSLAGTMCFTTVGALFLGETLKVANANTSYEINFTSSKNKLTNETAQSGTSNVTTELGSEYSIDYTNATGSLSSIWQSFDTNGQFSTTVNKEKVHDNAFFGMKSALFNFAEEGKNICIYFSKDGTFSDAYSRKYVTKSGTNEIEFEGHPHYFKFEAIDSIDIVSLKICYSCDSSIDEYWDSLHGVNPLVDDGTILYGIYPKTIVSPINEPELLSKLVEKATLLNIGNNVPFWYEDEYYLINAANPYQDDYFFSDGTSIVKDETYIFKCEPILWNICLSSDNNYTLDCSYVLDTHRFHSSMQNKYVKSEIRTWLNNDFYSNAFFLNNNLIEATNFSEISTNYDKVWLGSKDEYQTTWNRYAEERTKCFADYTLCNRVRIPTESPYEQKAQYWTRSKTSVSSLAMIIEYNGELLGNLTTDVDCGVVPAITLKI